jgi:flagellar basal body-associated protein FliL
MDNDMSDQAEAPAKPAGPPKQKPSLLILVLLVANIAATGYGVFLTMQGGEAAAHAAPAEQDAKKAEPEKPKNEVGPVTPLDPFIVNLNEPDASRYLKATFELEVASVEVIAHLEKLKRPVRDEVLRYLSSLSVADTQGEAGKANIQKEVVARIDRQLGGKSVRRLFIVEFMVQ